MNGVAYECRWVTRTFPRLHPIDFNFTVDNLDYDIAGGNMIVTGKFAALGADHAHLFR